MHQRKSKKLLIYFFLLIIISSTNNISLKNLELIKNEFLIIEIHPTSKSNQIKFEKNIHRYFNTREIFSNSNNFIDLQELHNLNDIDRNLLTSEGRSFIGKWLILEPKLKKQN